MPRVETSPARVAVRRALAASVVLLLGLSACSTGADVSAPTGVSAAPGTDSSAPAATQTPDTPRETSSEVPGTPSEEPSQTTGTPSETPSDQPGDQPGEQPSGTPAASPTKGPLQPDPSTPRWGKKGKIVFLTFDDGPDGNWTPQVLEVLRRYDAVATFFVIGSNARLFPELLEQIRADGHSLQNHTDDHPALTRLSRAGVREQVELTDAAIQASGAPASTCVRPPYGATDSGVRAALRSMGKLQALWDVDPQDWARPGSDAIARRVLSGVFSGAVILLHDGGGERSQTLAALPRILEGIQDRGYKFRTLCQR